MWIQSRIGEFIKKEDDYYQIVKIEEYSGFFVAVEGIVKEIHLQGLEKTQKEFVEEYGFEPETETLVIIHASKYQLLEFVETFESYLNVNEFLTRKGMPSLYMPLKVKEYGTWFCFESFGYGKKISETKMQIVMADRFSENHFHIRVRNTEHYSDEQLVDATYEYMEAFGKVPITDLEAETYEASTHGSSGMDHNHYGLKTEQEVHEILKNTYGINTEKILWS